MKYLLDTNVCIRFLNGRSQSIFRAFKSISPSRIAVCSVVRSELAYGAWKSSRPEENTQRLMYFCDQFVSVPFDDAAAQECGRIRAALNRAGMPIGPYDLQIAAIAVVSNRVLVTHNTREFSRVENLELEDWEI